LQDEEPEREPVQETKEETHQVAVREESQEKVQDLDMKKDPECSKEAGIDLMEEVIANP
jgi:hypothetical protein